MSIPISVVILAKNAAAHLHECLAALQPFAEIVLLDNESTDDTVAIARRFPNVVVIQHPFIGFGPLKNLAASHARHDWVLSVDSDEVLSAELVEEIQHLSLSVDQVYAILRNNYYQDRLVDCCGWQNDYVLRLYNRASGVCFNDRQVHESLQIGTRKIRRLQGSMKHYAFNSIEGLLEKMQRYSTLYALDHVGKKSTSPLKALLSAGFAFFRNYILLGGIGRGYEGFLISACNANGVLYKYLKLYEANKKCAAR